MREGTRIFVYLSYTAETMTSEKNESPDLWLYGVEHPGGVLGEPDAMADLALFGLRCIEHVEKEFQRLVSEYRTSALSVEVESRVKLAKTKTGDQNQLYERWRNAKNRERHEVRARPSRAVELITESLPRKTQKAITSPIPDQDLGALEPGINAFCGMYLNSSEVGLRVITLALMLEDTDRRHMSSRLLESIRSNPVLENVLVPGARPEPSRGEPRHERRRGDAPRQKASGKGKVLATQDLHPGLSRQVMGGSAGAA